MPEGRPCAWLGRTNEDLWNGGCNLLHDKADALLAAAKQQIAERRTYCWQPSPDPLCAQNFFPVEGADS